MGPRWGHGSGCLEGLWEVIWCHEGPSGCGDHGESRGTGGGSWECGWSLGTMDIRRGHGGPWWALGPWGAMSDHEVIGSLGGLQLTVGPGTTTEDHVGAWTGVLRD